MWRVNCLHPIYLAQAMTEKLLARDKRCGVLFTSSVAAYAIAPGFASYSATKHAVSNFGESLYFELKKNVDVTVWEPGYVESNIHLDTPPSAMTLTAKKAVRDAFNKFGARKTYGSLTFAMMPHGGAEWGNLGMKMVNDKMGLFNEAMDAKEKKAQEERNPNEIN